MTTQIPSPTTKNFNLEFLATASVLSSAIPATQCCQLADISAAKHKSGPIKKLSGRKNLRPNFLQICLKMAEKWPNFFEVSLSHENLDYLYK
jgi:hypothetical protein